MKEYITISAELGISSGARRFVRDGDPLTLRAKLNDYATQGYEFKGTVPDPDGEGTLIIMERNRICLCHEPGELE